MKKLAFLLAVIIVLSSFSVVTFASLDENYYTLMKVDYSEYDIGVLASHYNVAGNKNKPFAGSATCAAIPTSATEVASLSYNGSTYMPWWRNQGGGNFTFNAMLPNWGNMWLDNARFPKSEGNNYIIVHNQGGSKSDGNLYMGLTQYDNIQKVNMREDFSFEYSFNNLTLRPSSASESRPKGTMNICIYPAADYASSNGRNGEGAIVNIPVGGQITAVNDSAFVNVAAFSTTQAQWYDVRVDVDMSTDVPTYDLYMKKSSDSSYTTLAENLSFPKSANYSDGLTMNGVVEVVVPTKVTDTNPVFAFDDFELLTKTQPPVNVTLAECNDGKLTFAEGSSSNMGSGDEVTVNIEPDDGFKLVYIKVNGEDMTSAVNNSKLVFKADTDSEVTAFFAPHSELVYYQNYNGWDIEDGATYYHFPNSGTTSTWSLNFAGSWAHIWIADDARSVNGKYGIVYPGASAGSPDMYALKTYPTYGTDGRIALKEDFTLGFSVNSLGNLSNVSDSLGANLNGGIMDINLYSEAERVATGGNGREGEGKLITVDFGKTISVVDGSETKVIEGYTTPGIWYDIKVKVDYSANPTYDVYIKNTAEEDYALVAADCAFPEADYSVGIGMLGFATLKAANNSAFAFDNIEVYYDDELDVTLSSSANGAVSFEDSALTGSHAMVDANATITVDVTPDEGYSLKKITVNGQDMTAAVSGNKLSVTVTDNTDVKATFWRTPENEHSVDPVVIKVDKSGENPAIIIYSRLNNYTNGFNGGYGMYIWEGNGAKDASAFIKLPACASDNSEASAVPEQAYAIKVYGSAIKTGNAYSVMAYAGDATGEAETVEITE